MPLRVQDPGETLDWAINFTNELDAVGSPSDTLDSGTKSITIEGDDGSPQPNATSEQVSAGVYLVLVSGLRHGVIYRVRFSIATSQGRTLKRSITVRCEHR